jgi:hypothetical protein
MGKHVPEKCLLKPDGEYKTVETSLATLWMDHEGIMYSKSKNKKRSVEGLKEFFEAVKEFSRGEKVYLIGDVNEMQSYSEEAKEYLNKQMRENCLAFAILGCKPMGKMMAAVTILKQKPPFPAKMFETLEEARKWINELRSKE